MRANMCFGTWVVAAMVGLAAAPNGAKGQDLADFDYEHLSLRGVGFEWGYLYPSRVERTQSYGVRVDLGYLGPGLRIVPGVTYWKAAFRAAEIQEHDDRDAGLGRSQAGGPPPGAPAAAKEGRRSGSRPSCSAAMARMRYQGLRRFTSGRPEPRPAITQGEPSCSMPVRTSRAGALR